MGGGWLTPGGAYYEGDQITPDDAAVPQRPSAEHNWDGEAWVPNLEAAITRRCADVDSLRDAKFDDGMAYGGKVLQLRDVDQQRIIAAGADSKFALLASAPAVVSGWIMADNTVLPLDNAGMSAMADAAAVQVQSWIFTGYAHKQAIRALSDAASIVAYDITAGW